MAMAVASTDRSRQSDCGCGLMPIGVDTTNQMQQVPLTELNLIATEVWTDALSGKLYDDLDEVVEIPPYGAIWITNSRK